MTFGSEFACSFTFIPCEAFDKRLHHIYVPYLLFSSLFDVHYLQKMFQDSTVLTFVANFVSDIHWQHFKIMEYYSRDVYRKITLFLLPQCKLNFYFWSLEYWRMLIQMFAFYFDEFVFFHCWPNVQADTFFYLQEYFTLSLQIFGISLLFLFVTYFCYF